MEAINYESMKTNEPTRNFDSVDITNDYNVAAQNAQGLYGAFKFFHGIKSFFKGISALGTLATTSKIPVTDNDGNVTYTTPTAIKTALSLVDTTSLNGALADFTISDFNFNPTTIIADNNVGSKRFNTTFNPSNKPTGTNFFYGTLFHNTSGQYYLVGYDYSGTMFERRYLTSTSEWVDVTEVANKTWVNGALANLSKTGTITYNVDLSSTYEQFCKQYGNVVSVHFSIKPTETIPANTETLIATITNVSRPVAILRTVAFCGQFAYDTKTSCYCALNTSGEIRINLPNTTRDCINFDITYVV